MTDKELLELAAKAAGMNDWRWVGVFQCLCHYNVMMSCWYRDSEYDRIKWNPLADDGDALRLACACGLSVDINNAFCRATVIYGSGDDLQESHKNGTTAATRRAIVRAAAEIGKEMK